MIVLYFSGTGNSKFIAELFCKYADVECYSIEDDVNFGALFASNETIGFCYPIYGSRVPLIMREFIAKHISVLKNKKLIIFVTQLTFSGDGARVLCDLFPKNHIDVIYAEHFFMPNNVCNFALLRKTSDKSTQKRLEMADAKMKRVCRNIKNGVIKKRGFSVISRLSGKVQGIPWQGDSKNAFAAEGTMEYKAKHGVKIDADCTVCEICAERCPMRNLEKRQGKIEHNSNCTLCYRCINLCPEKAITVFFHKKPVWQYKGVKTIGKDSVRR
jgi:ferredoxin